MPIRDDSRYVQMYTAIADFVHELRESWNAEQAVQYTVDL